MRPTLRPNAKLVVKKIERPCPQAPPQAHDLGLLFANLLKFLFVAFQALSAIAERATRPESRAESHTTAGEETEATYTDGATASCTVTEVETAEGAVTFSVVSGAASRTTGRGETFETSSASHLLAQEADGSGSRGWNDCGVCAADALSGLLSAVAAARETLDAAAGPPMASQQRVELRDN